MLIADLTEAAQTRVLQRIKSMTLDAHLVLGVASIRARAESDKRHDDYVREFRIRMRKFLTEGE